MFGCWVTGEGGYSKLPDTPSPHPHPHSHPTHAHTQFQEEERCARGHLPVRVTKLVDQHGQERLLLLWALCKEVKHMPWSKGHGGEEDGRKVPDNEDPH